jgi:hypothetical protein
VFVDGRVRNVALQAGIKYAQRENPDLVAKLIRIF